MGDKLEVQACNFQIGGRPGEYRVLILGDGTFHKLAVGLSEGEAGAEVARLVARSDEGIVQGWTWEVRNPIGEGGWWVREVAPGAPAWLPTGPVVLRGLGEAEARRLAAWHNDRLECARAEYASEETLRAAEHGLTLEQDRWAQRQIGDVKKI